MALQEKWPKIAEDGYLISDFLSNAVPSPVIQFLLGIPNELCPRLPTLATDLYHVSHTRPDFYKILPATLGLIQKVRQEENGLLELQDRCEVWLEHIFNRKATPTGIEILTALPSCLRRKLPLKTQLSIMQLTTQEGFVRFKQACSEPQLLDIFLERANSEDLHDTILTILQGKINVTQEVFSLYCHLSRKTCERLDEGNTFSSIRKILWISLPKETSQICAKIVNGLCEAGMPSRYLYEVICYPMQPAQMSKLLETIETYPTLLKELVTTISSDDSYSTKQQFLTFLHTILYTMNSECHAEGIQIFVNLPEPLKKILRCKYVPIIKHATAYGFAYLQSFAEIFFDIIPNCLEHLNVDSMFSLLMIKHPEDTARLINHLKENGSLRTRLVSQLKSLKPETQSLLLNAMLPRGLLLSVKKITILLELSTQFIEWLAKDNNFLLSLLNHHGESLPALSHQFEQYPEHFKLLPKEAIADIIRPPLHQA